MYPSIPAGRIRPKISSMPRQKTEDTAYLEIYKLVVERKRLRRELIKIEQRREQIQQRLVILDQDIAKGENDVQDLRRQSSSPAQNHSSQANPSPLAYYREASKANSWANSGKTDDFETFTLDY